MNSNHCPIPVDRFGAILRPGDRVQGFGKTGTVEAVGMFPGYPASAHGMLPGSIRPDGVRVIVEGGAIASPAAHWELA